MSLSLASLSPLETQFQRIADELVALWPGSGLEPYLDQLIYTPRYGRHGFPLEVMSDLLFLAEVRWWMTHETGNAAFSPDQFSFGLPRKV